MREECCLCGASHDTWTCQTCEEVFCRDHWHHTELGNNVECAACERKRIARQEPGSFDDMNEEEFLDILRDMVTVDSLLSIGDIYMEARDHFNNEVLEVWARKNERCSECGARRDEDGDCCGGCDD